MIYTKTVCKCDRCETEADTLYTVKLPCTYIQDTGRKNLSVAQIELCSDCMRLLQDNLSNFVVIEDMEWIGLKVTKIESNTEKNEGT